jgi:hypothetical protein
MERWRSLGVTMLVLAAVVVAGHYYLWARLIRDPEIGLFDRRVLISILGVLALGIPVAVIAGRLVSPALSTWWLTPVYYWIGVSSLLAISVVLVDLARAAYSFGASSRGALSHDRRRFFARVGAGVAVVLGLAAGGVASRRRAPGSGQPRGSAPAETPDPTGERTRLGCCPPRG